MYIVFKNLLCSVHNAGYSIKTGSFKKRIRVRGAVKKE